MCPAVGVFGSTALDVCKLRPKGSGEFAFLAVSNREVALPAPDLPDRGDDRSRAAGEDLAQAP